LRFAYSQYLVQGELELELLDEENEIKQLGAKLALLEEQGEQAKTEIEKQQATVTLLEIQYKSSVEDLRKQVERMRSDINVSEE
jgi:hypothetical protein